MDDDGYCCALAPPGSLLNTAETDIAAGCRLREVYWTRQGRRSLRVGAARKFTGSPRRRISLRVAAARELTRWTTTVSVPVAASGKFTRRGSHGYRRALAPPGNLLEASPGGYCDYGVAHVVQPRELIDRVTTNWSRDAAPQIGRLYAEFTRCRPAVADWSSRNNQTSGGICRRSWQSRARVFTWLSLVAAWRLSNGRSLGAGKPAVRRLS
jgi:hypothetical protein